MEPDAAGYASNFGNVQNDANTVAVVSIAISLKRIADALSYQAAGDQNIFDMIRTMSEKS
jgi:hypothetical protein